MRRPVWLFSMDTEHFRAPPMTTGALKAHFLTYGRSANETEIALVHFLAAAELSSWRDDCWPHLVYPWARAGLEAGRQPVFGLSCYTWNVAEFLELARTIKNAIPEALVIAGGPHVQRAEDFLGDEAIDLVVLGEGEETFTELLDCRSEAAWESARGCAYLTPAGDVYRTGPRPRATDLDRFPSAVDVIELRDAAGRPLYKQVAYETSRGCPFRCAFCEWGTGAVGTKMYQFSLQRIRSDLAKLGSGGIEDLWLCDSNFGALREDLAKAELIVDLHVNTGRPRTFATSWAKNCSDRVRRIVRLLHQNDMLSHYHMALQTLTPKALELSHRTNMRANDYEPVVKSLAAEGIPVAAELIWGLPGDTLAEFAANLDHLLTVFPNINIFGYTLLPGTEFFDRREEYRLETIPVAGYGKAKGEYVVGCSSFSREEGEEGYFLITAYIILARGQLMPRAAQLLALDGRVPVSAVLREVLRDLMLAFQSSLPAPLGTDRIAAYERRAALYLTFLSRLDRCYQTIGGTLARCLADYRVDELGDQVARVLELDYAFCPRAGKSRTQRHVFGFAADRADAALRQMERPDPRWLERRDSTELEISYPGGVGDLLLDPDGGAWVRGRLVPGGAGVATS